MNIGNGGPDITHEHPEYAAKRAMWRQYRDLYAGGAQFIASADQYLVRRQKEPGDVFVERLSRSFYENYVGSIVDWYTATLFRREPGSEFRGKQRAVQEVLWRVRGRLRPEGHEPARSSFGGNLWRRWFAERATC